MASWRDFFKNELEQPYLIQLQDFLIQERLKKEIYPPADHVFQAMSSTPLEKLRVIVVGQDPYHGPGQAMGLSFSVPKGIPLPPSLRNIFKEIEDDLKIKMTATGDLTKWAQQGVLLLNTLLTVRRGEPLSHKGMGWENFTDHLLEFVAKQPQPLVFLLWGSPAQQKVEKILNSTRGGHERLILKAPHPSPLSAHRGFLGCRHFSKTNEWLITKGQLPIDWQL